MRPSTIVIIIYILYFYYYIASKRVCECVFVCENCTYACVFGALLACARFIFCKNSFRRVCVSRDVFMTNSRKTCGTDESKFLPTFFGFFRCSRRRLQNEQWCSNDTVVEILSTNHDDIITSSLKRKGTLSNRPDNFIVFRHSPPSSSSTSGKL